MPEAAEVLRETNFTAIDWVIVIAYPLISLGIGLYVRRFITNMKDFVVAGQGLGVCLGIATMTGTELGLITVMYSAQKGFTGGFAAFHIALAAGIVTFLVGVTGFFVYRLREMGVLTIPEFYERRFDRKTRILGGIMMALGGHPQHGAVPEGGVHVHRRHHRPVRGELGPAGRDGLPDHAGADLHVPGRHGLGRHRRLRPVRRALVRPAADHGAGHAPPGLDEHLRHRQAADGHRAVSIPRSPKAALAGSTSSGWGSWGWSVAASGRRPSPGPWPWTVPQAVKRQYMFASISYLIRFLIPYFWGICAFVFIMQHDELQRRCSSPPAIRRRTRCPKALQAVDNLYAHAAVPGPDPAGRAHRDHHRRHGRRVHVTHDSYLLCWSSRADPGRGRPALRVARPPTELAKPRDPLTRVFIVVIGLYVLYWGLIYHGDDDIWDYMAVTGAIYFTGAFALLLGGLYWKRASSTGAFLALLAGADGDPGPQPGSGCVGSPGHEGAFECRTDQGRHSQRPRRPDLDRGHRRCNGRRIAAIPRPKNDDTFQRHRRERRMMPLEFWIWLWKVVFWQASDCSPPWPSSLRSVGLSTYANSFGRYAKNTLETRPPAPTKTRRRNRVGWLQ